MREQPSMTKRTIEVLRAMLERPKEPVYGHGLIASEGFATGTVQPILMGLEDAGWAVSEWEPPGGGKPSRRYYRLTPEGKRHARNAVRAADKKAAG